MTMVRLGSRVTEAMIAFRKKSPLLTPYQQTLHNKSPPTHIPNHSLTPRDTPSHLTPRIYEARIVPSSPAGWYWPPPDAPPKGGVTCSQARPLHQTRTHEKHTQLTATARATRDAKAQRHTHTPQWKRQRPTDRVGPSHPLSSSLSPPRRAEQNDPKRRNKCNLRSHAIPHMRKQVRVLRNSRCPTCCSQN